MPRPSTLTEQSQEPSTAAQDPEKPSQAAVEVAAVKAEGADDPAPGVGVEQAACGQDGCEAGALPNFSYFYHTLLFLVLCYCLQEVQPCHSNGQALYSGMIDTGQELFKLADLSAQAS